MGLILYLHTPRLAIPRLALIVDWVSINGHNDRLEAGSCDCPNSN